VTHHYLRDLVREYPDETAESVARKALTEPEQLVDVVAKAVDDIRRNETRDVERTRITALLRAPDPQYPTLTRKERTKALHAQFKVADEWWATWGTATVDEHERRIAMLEKLIEGTRSTIALHREAIAKITAANATCLAEVVT
jgi:hypothetical protein